MKELSFFIGGHGIHGKFYDTGIVLMIMNVGKQLKPVVHIGQQMM